METSVFFLWRKVKVISQNWGHLQHCIRWTIYDRKHIVTFLLGRLSCMLVYVNGMQSLP